MGTTQTKEVTTLEQLKEWGSASDKQLQPYIKTKWVDREASNWHGQTVYQCDDIEGNRWGWSPEDNQWEMAEEIRMSMSMWEE